MIPDLDAVLRSLLADVGAPLRLSLPRPDWDGAATVSALLHSVVEDLAARNGSWRDVRSDEGRVTAREEPLRRYSVGYLVTTWADDEDLEHALAGTVLECLAEIDVVPDEHLTDVLRGTGEAVQLSTAQPGAGSAMPLWHALGIAPRPVLPVLLTASLARSSRSVADAPGGLDLGVGAPPALPVEPPSPRPRRAGRIREGAR